MHVSWYDRFVNAMFSQCHVLSDTFPHFDFRGVANVSPTNSLLYENSSTEALTVAAVESMLGGTVQAICDNTVTALVPPRGGSTASRVICR